MALKLAPDQNVSQLTVGELKEIVREALREEQEYYLDKDGYLVFMNEKTYAAYLDKQKGKLPSEVNAYYLDEHGFKVCYSDYEPTPKKARELDAAKKEPTIPFEQVLEELRAADVKV